MTYITTKTAAALPIVAVLLVAAIASPSLGLVDFVAAKKQKVDAMDDTNPGIYDEHFPSLSDLDIKNYGFGKKGDKMNAYMEVYGVPGGTKANHDMHEEGDEGHGYAIAYAITVNTKHGIETWAIDSHEAQHGGGEGDEWHAHKVVLGDNPDSTAVEGDNCLNEVDHVTHAMMDGNKIIFEDMKVKTKNGVEGIDAKSIISAKTVLLQLQVEDPDAERDPEVNPCIALVRQVFDSAELGKISS
jgi:hypothetical protein